MDDLRTNAGRIVIVDDSEPYLSALEAILRAQNYEHVSLFNDPLAALEGLKGGACDLLLLDLHMPGMSGIELLQELRREGVLDDTVPVLILTGDADPNLRDTALELGTMDYIVKPFRGREVMLRVRNLLRMRMLHLQVLGRSEELEREVRQRTEQLEDAYLETVHRLARAAEYRDDDTGKHILRVGKLASAVATRLGLNGRFPEEILVAAQLHDVGKIAIPDNVLLKPGKLTPDEFDIIKRHTLVGEGLLRGSNSALLQLAAEIAVSHHERWDGSGYPHGLAGDAIPIAGRIAAVADVFDALTHERPYKKAWTREDAMEELRRQRGKMFDPDVVDAFVLLPRRDSDEEVVDDQAGLPVSS